MVDRHTETAPRRPHQKPPRGLSFVILSALGNLTNFKIHCLTVQESNKTIGFTDRKMLRFMLLTLRVSHPVEFSAGACNSAKTQPVFVCERENERCVAAAKTLSATQRCPRHSCEKTRPVFVYDRENERRVAADQLCPVHDTAARRPHYREESSPVYRDYCVYLLSCCLRQRRDDREPTFARGTREQQRWRTIRSVTLSSCARARLFPRITPCCRTRCRTRRLGCASVQTGL